jgi:hypothetical protein
VQVQGARVTFLGKPRVIAHVALNQFTNYVNVLLDVAVDFSSVKFRWAA